MHYYTFSFCCTGVFDRIRFSRDELISRLLSSEKMDFFILQGSSNIRI